MCTEFFHLNFKCIRCISILSSQVVSHTLTVRNGGCFCAAMDTLMDQAGVLGKVVRLFLIFCDYMWSCVIVLDLVLLYVGVYCGDLLTITAFNIYNVLSSLPNFDKLLWIFTSFKRERAIGSVIRLNLTGTQLQWHAITISFGSACHIWHSAFILTFNTPDVIPGLMWTLQPL